MFGRSRPVVINTYGRRRPGWRPPRWLVLLLLGTTAGAAGVITVQQHYLPPRLSLAASAELRSAFEKAEAERLRLDEHLRKAQQQLLSTQAERQSLAAEVATGRAASTRLREDLASVVAALAPDPRDSAVSVRAARFTAKAGVLNYDLVLTRAQAGGKPLAGQLQLQVAGSSGQGTPLTVTPRPIPLSVGSHEVLRGSVPLPEGFRPRQTTVQVLDQAAGKSLGMRVMLVP